MIKDKHFKKRYIFLQQKNAVSIAIAISDLDIV